MKDKFKALTFREKIGFIFDYYKWHIICTIISVYLVGYFINIIWINPAEQPYVQAAIYGSFAPIEGLIQFEDKLNADYLPETARGDFLYVVENFYHDTNPQVSMALTQKFAALMVSKELDIIIAEEENFKGLMSEGYFSDLKTILTPEQFKQIENKTVEGEVVETGEKATYGIDISDNKLFESFDFRLKKPIIGFVCNTKRLYASVSTVFKMIEN